MMVKVGIYKPEGKTADGYRLVKGRTGRVADGCQWRSPMCARSILVISSAGGITWKLCRDTQGGILYGCIGNGIDCQSSAILRKPTPIFLARRRKTN